MTMLRSIHTAIARTAVRFLAPALDEREAGRQGTRAERIEAIEARQRQERRKAVVIAASDHARGGLSGPEIKRRLLADGASDAEASDAIRDLCIKIPPQPEPACPPLDTTIDLTTAEVLKAGPRSRQVPRSG